jgi:hypothetical protein
MLQKQSKCFWFGQKWPILRQKWLKLAHKKYAANFMFDVERSN